MQVAKRKEKQDTCHGRTRGPECVFFFFFLLFSTSMTCFLAPQPSKPGHLLPSRCISPLASGGERLSGDKQEGKEKEMKRLMFLRFSFSVFTNSLLLLALYSRYSPCVCYSCYFYCSRYLKLRPMTSIGRLGVSTSFAPPALLPLPPSRSHRANL